MSLIWTGVTQEWLRYGFGRVYDVSPSVPYTGVGALLQQAQNFSTSSYPYGPVPERNQPSDSDPPATAKRRRPAAATGSATQRYKWIPINFYDSREGEPRDTRPTGATATNVSPIGVMNAVELDVGNLWLWLQSKAGTAYAGGSGHRWVNKGTNQNGYILYFSDHRGMQPDPDRKPNVDFYNDFLACPAWKISSIPARHLGVPDGKLEADDLLAPPPPLLIHRKIRP